MKLPVCKFDLESDTLCGNCQEKLDNGEITKFDVAFSGWLLGRARSVPSIEDLTLLRAINAAGRLVLVVKKKHRAKLEAAQDLIDEMTERFGEVLIIEGPVKLRTLVRRLIHPVVEVGVNSLYLPDGVRESIVMLRAEDRDRVPYTKEDLRAIVSAVLGEMVLFQFEDDRIEKEEESSDGFDEKMREFTERRW